MTSRANAAWPKLPFLGLRRFEEEDRALYCGRAHDLSLCIDRLASPAVRILVLQGLSGSGKSSFLRAGLVPEMRTLLRNEPKEGIVPICGVVSAGTGMMKSIARQVYEFVINGAGRTMWNKQAEKLVLRYPQREAFASKAADDVDILIDFISELSTNPRYSVMLTIDQVEEFWSLPGTPETDALRKSFLGLVYEFALERLSGKLVLSIRTEQYGIFASELPDSMTPAFARIRGVNKLCHHFLANPSKDELIALIRHPAIHYKFSFEEQLPELIVENLRAAAKDPEMCVLPLLQTVLLRLYLTAVAEADVTAVAAPLVITTAAFQALLETADGTSVGLLRDFVRWGLGRAVARVLEVNEARDDGRVRQRMEVYCWQAVLPAMSDGNASGTRIRARKSIAEIEALARDAECEARPSAMIEALISADVGLLARAEEKDTYTLQHDLICLAFDQPSAIGSSGFWLQAARNRRKRIDKAARYRLSHLFDDGDAPAVERLRVAELRFWDHKTLAFANELGFFDRLGFSVECVSCDEDVSATELVEKLACDSDTHAVYSYPRVSMSETEQQASQDIVVLNSFTGFAVICNAAAALPGYREDDEWKSFDEVTSALLALRHLGGRYLAEDSLAKEFFDNLLSIKRLRSSDDVTEAAAIVSSMTLCSDDAGISFVESLLRETSPCVAILTTPTWALAMMLGECALSLVIDQRTLINLLEERDNGSNTGWSAIRRKLEVRNVLNLRPARGWPDLNHEPMMMRLASIGLFLADYIWAQDVKAGDWIRERWSSTAAGAHDCMRRISRTVFLDAFRRSCGFAASDEYGARYFGDWWPDDCPTALSLHHKLLRARMDYERQTAALGALVRKPDAAVEERTAALIRRARKHADINNYYDAKRLIDRAMIELEAALQPR